MTAEEMRQRVQELIRNWLQNERVQQDELTVLTLGALAGDIDMIEVK